MAMGANPWGARLSVAPKIISRNIKVITISTTSADNRLYPPGECSPYPFEAKPAVTSKPAWPKAITYNTAAPAIPPATCTAIYGMSSEVGNLPPDPHP